MAAYLSMLVASLAAAQPTSVTPSSLGGPSIDTTTLAAPSARLREQIIDAIRSAGGDPEHQYMHMVLGFSTGYFSLDPLAAEAARSIAWRAIGTWLIQGDRLSVYAWEMGIWDRKDETVTEDRETQKTRLEDLFPLTPRAGSQGGHDTELTLVQITKQLGDAPNAIVVLISNTAASIGTPDQKPIGTNDPRYQAMLEKWNRLPAINKSGASLELPYVEIDSTGTKVPRSLDAVIVVPRHLAGQQFGGPTRTQRLNGQITVVGKTQGPQTHQPRGLVLWPLIALVIVSLLAYATLGPPDLLPRLRGLIVSERRLVLIVGDPDTPLDQRQKFPLSPIPYRHEVCHIAGPHYPDHNERTVTVGVEQGAPPLRLARVVRQPGGVGIRSATFRLRAVDDKAVQGEVTLRGKGAHRVALSGTYEPDPTQSPRNLSLSVEVSLLDDRQQGGGGSK